MTEPILRIQKLGFPWVTQDPFLFCVHHLDYYPKGNDKLGPDASLQRRNLGNDFVVKDGWRMYHGTEVPGFPVHPHRGFETITFVFKGMVDHSDSNGAAGRYGERDVQWMTAGSGLQHSEMFPLLKKNETNTLELFQIWLNLPGEKKFVKPAYKMLWGEEIPLIEFTDDKHKKTSVDVIAGKIENISAPEPTPDSWAFNEENNIAIWQITMDEDASWKIPVSKEKINRSLYFFEGNSIQINHKKIESNHLLELDSTQEITIHNGNTSGRFLLLQGKPINEPVVQYGPFVMNSELEIKQAFSDYKKTQFGGWPWPETGMVHGKERGRFAKMENGEEILKD
ncbi:pirin family protein [Maribellus maritimus]|uniref:pirin family protein n=1 Tax=Maribellus maritimus TaxID=2870838 RepID=UPI001EEC7792|nr:pirin-like C-terminal cupin domain-containing protein [Maribellus maritimus]MCG6187801.1 pirin family protein [Maribellus maritimus]